MPATHAHHAPASEHARHRPMTGAHHYARLLLMTVLSFAAMYFLMYAMIDSFDSYYNNINPQAERGDHRHERRSAPGLLGS